jgi:hypothetical protein
VYTTSLYLKELIGENVLFAYRLNGQFLEEGTGAPLGWLLQPSMPTKAPCGSYTSNSHQKRTGVLGNYGVTATQQTSGKTTASQNKLHTTG